MKNSTLKLFPLLMAVPFAFITVACGDKDDTLTADNVTVEECNDLFGEVEESEATESTDDSSEEMVEGDYDADGDADEDDEAIEKKCEELMAEAEAEDEMTDDTDAEATDEEAAE